MDERLLLLPNRNSHAQPPPTGGTAGGDRMEETTVRSAGAEDRPGRDREIEKTRSTSSRASRGDRKIGNAHPCGRSLTTDRSRQPNLARARPARPGAAA